MCVGPVLCAGTESMGGGLPAKGPRTRHPLLCCFHLRQSSTLLSPPSLAGRSRHFVGDKTRAKPRETRETCAKPARNLDEIAKLRETSRKFGEPARNHAKPRETTAKRTRSSCQAGGYSQNLGYALESLLYTSSSTRSDYWYMSRTTRPSWFLRDMPYAKLSDCVSTGKQIVRVDGSYDQFVENLLQELRVSPPVGNAALGALPCVEPDSGLWLEFGVFRGNTMRQIANYRNASHRWSERICCVHGFDSFRGLPERWREDRIIDGRVIDFGAGVFNLHGRVPYPETAIIRWVPGWFNESLPAFLRDRPRSEHVSLLHVDSDLYSSASTIFGELGHRLRAGSVIIFDELFGYPQYRKHEIRAFYEFLRSRRSLAAEVLGTSTHQIASAPTHEYGSQACAVRLVRA